jgi:hypothetical protein
MISRTAFDPTPREDDKIGNDNGLIRIWGMNRFMVYLTPFINVISMGKPLLIKYKAVSLHGEQFVYQKHWLTIFLPPHSVSLFPQMQYSPLLARQSTPKKPNI